MQLVEVIVVVNAGSESFEVLLEHCYLVQCLIDHGEVLLLHVAHVVHSERECLVLAEKVHHTGMI